MKIPLIVLIASLLAAANADQFNHLEFFEYCRSLDYPVEDHLIPTEDHYNLRFYRLQAKSTSIQSGKRVVYLQHGLVDSSDTWIVNDEHLATAFILANRGFDVWVGNSRGNRYSSKALSPSPLKFWDFSFHEMGVYDVPAAFRYITKATGRKIHYIGHSQGTLSMFIALSQQISIVRDNLLSFHAFGPVAYLTHQKSKAMAALAKTDLAVILNKNHIKEVFLVGKDGLLVTSLTCKTLPIVCAQMLLAISDSNNTVNNMKRMPFIMGHFPAGSSTKNFVHFEQFVKEPFFRQYNYGEKKNQVIYGQKTPPLYDLAKITTDVHLYVGKYDKLADPEDSQKLFSELKNSSGKTIKIYDFGHATFVWGKSTQHITDALAVIDKVEPVHSLHSQ